MTERTEISLEPFSVIDVDLFCVDLYYIVTENDPVYNPMITFFTHNEDGELQHCFTLETQLLSDDPFEAASYALKTAYAFTSDFIPDIDVYDENGRQIDKLIDFDLDDVYNSVTAIDK